MSDRPVARSSRAPAQFGWLTGGMIGAAALVVAPMIHALDTNYLIPTHWRITFVAVGIASAAGCFTLGRGWFTWALFAAIGVMCAFTVRVWLDVAKDPTNHNLLPFELVIDFVNVFAWALIGAAAGAATRHLADRPGEQGSWTPRWRRPR